MSTGTYYAWEIQNPTFSGSPWAQLVGTSAYRSSDHAVVFGSAVPQHDGGAYCAHQLQPTLRLYRRNRLAAMNESSITSGKPGVGVRGQTSSQGSIYQVSLGPIDTTPPLLIDGT